MKTNVKEFGLEHNYVIAATLKKADGNGTFPIKYYIEIGGDL
jgi:hypothetical protein